MSVTLRIVPRISFGTFAIEAEDSGAFFIYNKDGEAMGISEENLAALIQKFWDEEF